MTQCDDKSWQKDFLKMESHSPDDAKLLMGFEIIIKHQSRNRYDAE